MLLHLLVIMKKIVNFFLGVVVVLLVVAAVVRELRNPAPWNEGASRELGMRLTQGGK